MESMRSLGLNPTQALMHPGLYYYMAARCTENRRLRFLRALENDVSPDVISEMTRKLIIRSSLQAALQPLHQALPMRTKLII